MEALKVLNLQHFKRMKDFKKSPNEKTFTALLHLLCKYNPQVPIDENGKLKTDNVWQTAQDLMVDPQKFVDNLVEFKNKVENEEIPASNFGAIRDILADKTFTPEIINKSCPPAAALCDWVINITSYYDVTVSLEPKRQAAKEALETLTQAAAKTSLNQEDYKVDLQLKFYKVDPITVTQGPPPEQKHKGFWSAIESVTSAPATQKPLSEINSKPDPVQKQDADELVDLLTPQPTTIKNQDAENEAKISSSVVAKESSVQSQDIHVSKKEGANIPVKQSAPQQLDLAPQQPSEQTGTIPPLGFSKLSAVGSQRDSSNMTRAEREAMAEVKRADRIAKRRLIELEEQRIEQDIVNKEQEALAKKERFIARSKSRGKSTSPANVAPKPLSKAEKREADADTSIFTAHDGGYILEYKAPAPYPTGPELPPSNLPIAQNSPPKPTKQLKALAKYADGNFGKEGTCITCGRARCVNQECILLKQGWSFDRSKSSTLQDSQILSSKQQQSFIEQPKIMRVEDSGVYEHQAMLNQGFQQQIVQQEDHLTSSPNYNIDFQMEPPQDQFQDTFQKNEFSVQQEQVNQSGQNLLDQNRQRIVSDNQLQMFQNQQNAFQGSSSKKSSQNRNQEQIARQFNGHLTRVYSKDSHQDGLKNCFYLIDINCEQPEVSKHFLKALLDKSMPVQAKQQGPRCLPFLTAHAQLIGYMASKFQINMDKESNMAKTVTKIVTGMKEMFFSESNDNLRSACAHSLSQVLESCFINKRIARGTDRAKDLIFHPLFDELSNPNERVRQSACQILKILNSIYMQDPDVVNVLHAHTISGLGIKNKIFDGEYLMCVTDLLNAHGVAITLGQVKFLPKALAHFIQSVHYNFKRPHSVERQNHILASLTTLTAFAYRCVDTEFAQQAITNFLQQLSDTLELLNNENQHIQDLKRSCIEAWKKLTIFVQDEKIRVEQANIQQISQQFLGDQVQLQDQMLRENFQTPDFSNKNTPMNQDLQRQSEGLPELENHMIELGTQNNQQAFHQSSFGGLPGVQQVEEQPTEQQQMQKATDPIEQQPESSQLTAEMGEVQKNFDSRLQLINKKMNNIEQKVFATQKNMNSIANAPISESESKSPKNEKRNNDKETLQQMLVALQKQQEQINQFMQNTQQDLKQMETQITQQNQLAQQLQEKNATQPQMISELAQALHDKQQEERLKNSIQNLDKKLAAGHPQFAESVNPVQTLQQQQPFFDKRNQQSTQKMPFTQGQTQFAQNNHLNSGQNFYNPQLDTINQRVSTAQPKRELTYIDKKVIKNEKLSAVWLTISKLALEHDYQRAYETALTQSDDIYLLRLIVQTGPVLSKGLTDTTGKRVLQRLNRIVRGGIFYKIQIEWLDESRKCELFKNLNKHEQNEYMDTLYQFANPNSDLVKKELKERAGEIYHTIRNQARHNQYY